MLARQYSERYAGIPVFLAETNLGGPVERRVQWFESLVQATRRARAAGTPVAGLSWYGAIDHVDWDSALRVRNRNINPCGMWSLERVGDRLLRTPTDLVEVFRRYIAMPVADGVGELTDPGLRERITAGSGAGEQDRRLARRASVSGVTKSTQVRQALDALNDLDTPARGRTPAGRRCLDPAGERDHASL